MTQRKPPGVSWESWTEEQIRTAQEQGAFDALPGAGKPLPDLGAAHDPLWWVKKLVQRERLSVLPPALQIKAQVEQELERIWKLEDEPEVRVRVAALNKEIAKVNATTTWGPATAVAQVDVEVIVQRWRERRPAD